MKTAIAKSLPIADWQRKRVFLGVFSVFLLFATLLMFAGCGSKGRNYKLDRDVARQSLTEFLETWKGGGTPEVLKGKTRQIVGSDQDWDAGKKLFGFEILSMDKDDGSNVHAKVQLELEEKGIRKKKEITYIIGTSPVVSIFRD